MPSSELLLRRYAARRDPADLEALVVRHLGLARALARRHASGGAGHEDLEQVACLGLVKALKRFDPSRGCAFTTYAVPTIAGELKRWSRQTAWTPHVPRPAQERVLAVRAAADELTTARGKPATPREIAGALGWDVEDVVDSLVAQEALAPVPLHTDAGEPLEGPALATEDPGFELAESRATVERALARVSGEERELVRLRFDAELTYEQIARRLDSTPRAVARRLRGTVMRLAELAGGADPPRDGGQPPCRPRRR